MRNTSEAVATASDTLRLTTTMTVFETRFPTTGSRPTMKVSTTSVFANGRWIPRSGRTPIR